MKERHMCKEQKMRGRERKGNKPLGTQADLNQLAISSVFRQVHANEDDKQIGLQQKMFLL